METHSADIEIYGKKLRIKCPTTYLLGVHLFYLGRTEYVPFLQWGLRRFDRVEPKYIVDVGANTGFYTSLFKLAFPDAGVLAIEPSSYNYPYLIYNTQTFTDVEYMQKAAHNKDEIIQIALPSLEQRAGSNTRITSAHLSIYGKTDGLRESVMGMPLDKLVRKKVDVLKIDVEGHEVPVLEGATEILKEHRPILMVEILSSTQEMSEYTPKELREFIESFGYEKIGKMAADFIFYPLEAINDILRRNRKQP